MQCQVFNSCMENPGENKFGAFTTSFTLNLYIMYNQRFLLERELPFLVVGLSNTMLIK